MIDLGSKRFKNRNNITYAVNSGVKKLYFSVLYSHVNQ